VVPMVDFFEESRTGFYPLFLGKSNIKGPSRESKRLGFSTVVSGGPPEELFSPLAHLLSFFQTVSHLEHVLDTLTRRSFAFASYNLLRYRWQEYLG